MITLEKTDCKGVVELKEALQQNMNRYFYGGDVRQHFISIEKSELHVIATLLDPRFKKKGFFSQCEADQADLLLVQLLAAALTEIIKNKSLRKERIFYGRIG